MAYVLTASRLDRAEACPASAALPAVYTQGSAYATEGTAAHELLERVALGDRADVPAWLCDLYDTLTEGATAVYAERCYAWSPETGVGRDLGTSGRDYSGLARGEIGGTADLVIVRPREVIVWDYKSGFLGASLDSAQLSLLALAVAGALGVDEIAVGIVQLDIATKLASPRAKILDALDLAAEAGRARRIVERVTRARALVDAGRTPDVRITEDGCRYCPAKMACPGRVGAIATLASVAGLAEPTVRIPVTVESAGAVWLAIDAMRAVLRAAEEEVQSLARVAPVPLPDGRELWAVETPRETVGDVEAIERLIAERYGADAVAEVVKLEKTASKGAIEALAKSKAPKGKGAGDARALIAAARAAGALKQTTHLAYAAKDRKAGLR